MFYKHGACAIDNHYFRGFFRPLAYQLLCYYLKYFVFEVRPIHPCEYLRSDVFKQVLTVFKHCTERGLAKGVSSCLKARWHREQSKPWQLWCCSLFKSHANTTGAESAAIYIPIRSRSRNLFEAARLRLFIVLPNLSRGISCFDNG